MKWASLVLSPPLSGALATWAILHVHALAALGLTSTSLRGVIAYVVIFAVTAVTTFLVHHNILKGVYAPGGTTKSGKRRLV